MVFGEGLANKFSSLGGRKKRASSQKSKTTVREKGSPLPCPKWQPVENVGSRATGCLLETALAPTRSISKMKISPWKKALIVRPGFPSYGHRSLGLIPGISGNRQAVSGMPSS